MENRTKIYFASDIHLGSNFFEDTRITEKRFVQWLDSIMPDAKALYLLGDVFDYWFEYKYVVPKGFVRFLGKIAEMTDHGIEVHFFIGNHDIWAFDYLPKEIGVILHKEVYLTEIHGKKFYLAHGDGLGDNSRSFKLIRSIFHSKICQKMYAAIHPRWTFAFAHRWSGYSRKEGLDAGDAGYLGEDKEYLVKFAKQQILKMPDIDFFIFGHRHIMLDLMLNKKTRLLIIGDWLQHYSYAVLDETGNISLEQFS